ncbi:MAG: aldo/keto reductase [Caldilineaceae bacterium]|nr:aldo/keto reductase [Caldilineaceae bacterium]
MEKRDFGNTGMQVTTLGYGAMELRHVDDAQAERLLNGVLDAGINFIDTSPDYGPSEDLIGKFIAHRRHEYFLATKCGCNVPQSGGDDAPRHIWTGAQVRHNIEHSLQRLKTDYVDVWQVHSADPDELAQSDVLETMLKIKDEGKVRHIAVSMSGRGDGHGYGQLRPYLDGDWDAFEAIQVWYSALTRASENAMTEAANRGKGMIIRGVVRRIDPYASVEDFAAQTGLSDLYPRSENAAQFLLRYAISHPALHTTIIGTKSLAHLAENIAAVEAGPLPSDIMATAQARLDAAGISPFD